MESANVGRQPDVCRDYHESMSDDTSTLPLRGDSITLAQAVKAVGLAGSGAQAKHLVRDGTITVNGTVVTQPGRQLRVGDRFGTTGGSEWTIS
jgi:ribosome-associated protein